MDGNHRFDRILLDLVYLGRLLGPGAQWVVLRTSAVPDTRPFDHYVEF